MRSERKEQTGKKMDKRLLVSSIICFCLGLAAGVGVVKLPDWVNEQKNTAKKETEEMGYDAVQIVKLGEYKGIEVSLTPTEDDIQAEIDSLLEENTNYEQLKTTAKDGDKVHATVKASVDGEEVDSAGFSDYVDLGSGMELQKIEETLDGMKSGEEKEVSVEVPDGHYGDTMIDGKKAEFHIKLDYVCGEALLPDYNDEFVKKVTSYDSVKEYNAYLEKKLKEENEEDKAEYAWTLVLENSEVDDGDYPKVLLDQQKKEILQGYYDFAEISGISRDEAFQQFGCEDEQDYIDTELDAAAKDGAKDILVSEAIAVKENIFYTEKDYKTLLNREYEENQDMYKDKEDYEKKNKAYLENTALMETVKSFIDKHAKYK